MSKIDVLIMVIVVIFATSFIGGHFGYTVNGVPRGGEAVDRDEWVPVYVTDMNTGTPVLVYFENINTGERAEADEIDYWGESGNTFLDAITFMYDMATFSVDDCPEWINAIFIAMNILMLLLIYLCIRGN